MLASTLSLNPFFSDAFLGLSGPVTNLPVDVIAYRLETFIYFSFVTLTTLGYGDIAPLAAPLRSFSYFEAVIGQLFIATIIARFIASSIKKKG